MSPPPCRPWLPEPPCNAAPAGQLTAPYREEPTFPWIRGNPAGPGRGGVPPAGRRGGRQDLARPAVDARTRDPAGSPGADAGTAEAPSRDRGTPQPGPPWAAAEGRPRAAQEPRCLRQRGSGPGAGRQPGRPSRIVPSPGRQEITGGTPNLYLRTSESGVPANRDAEASLVRRNCSGPSGEGRLALPISNEQFGADFRSKRVVHILEPDQLSLQVAYSLLEAAHLRDDAGIWPADVAE